MKIEQTPLEKITPYARNPRVPGAAIVKVMASIKAFGFRQPIVTDAIPIVCATLEAPLDLITPIAKRRSRVMFSGPWPARMRLRSSS